MSVFRGTIRPPATLSDAAVERALAAVRADITPDPLFRRRLRGEVMNRYVAAREGIGAAPRRRSMGRLGRAILYASFTLAATTTSVLAASQEALPGDLLYPLKRHVESLRAEVLPAHLQDDLAADALAERLGELGRLADRGDWRRVAIQVAAVERDYAAFLALADAAAQGDNDRHLLVLAGLIEQLPDPARAAVEAVIERAPGTEPANPLGPARTGIPPTEGQRGAAGAGERDLGEAGASAGLKPSKGSRAAPTPREARGANVPVDGVSAAEGGDE